MELIQAFSAMLWIAFGGVSVALTVGEIKHPTFAVYFGIVMLFLGAVVTTVVPFLLTRHLIRTAKELDDAPPNPGDKKPATKAAIKPPLAN